MSNRTVHFDTIFGHASGIAPNVIAPNVSQSAIEARRYKKIGPSQNEDTLDVSCGLRGFCEEVNGSPFGRVSESK